MTVHATSETTAAHDRLQHLIPTSGWCECTGTGLLAVSGSDARAFLHRQLSTDILRLDPTGCRLTSWSDGKGRLQAVMHIVARGDDRFLLNLAQGETETVSRGLARYVLRDDVHLADVTADHDILGIAGEPGETALEAALGGPAPGPGGHWITENGISVLRLAGSLPRWLVCGSPDATRDLRGILADALPTLDDAQWLGLRLGAGVPAIHEGTRGRFTAQMVNLDLLDAIDFDKGCYPGQEVIARTHYLGRIKRRMFVLTIDTASAPEPGAELWPAAHADAAVGSVVEATAVAGDHVLATAVLHLDAAARSLALGAADGPAAHVIRAPADDN